MGDIKVGILGTGFSATAHIEALQRIPSVQVVAVASSRLSRAEEIAAKYRIPMYYGEAMELIQDPDIQVVHNCTANHLHFEYNKAALLAGKHVLSEKPLSVTVKESDELQQLAKEKGLVAGVSYIYRHYPLVEEIKQQIAAQTYGNPYYITGGYLQDWLQHATDYNWRMDSELNGPSRAMADIGSHWVDTVQYVVGKKIVSVFADLGIVHPVRYKPKDQVNTFNASLPAIEDCEPVKVDTEDFGSVLVRFEGGMKGVFAISQVSSGRKNKLYFEIAAEHGALRWDQEEANRLWIGSRDVPNRILMRDASLMSDQAASITHYPGGHEEGWPDALKNLFYDFYRTISKKGNEPKVHSKFATFEQACGVMRIVEAILESHKRQQWVDI
ncbi:Gfo/Idh/MocA family protein [Paenibacillus lutrae]|uniref:Gfo/Idh/MocA family oxidoreductase n=1 Tax=Paenibacillus lutrae TaxID=2078573 RepID=A0A7X3FHH5_9BACL|nr:Gfo/Idh/MocA family oxidoreductase [Paenibacillus lutrae]MVO99742.1 gfo/Idh/MocA family oxidoreductase [Paenibacillus lutrae]